jgi:Metal-dependent hydrolases of the beta-lactamase superfamily I
MRFFVLASGSQGNSTFIDFDGIGVLIDCGISKKQLVYRLEQVGYSLKDIQYVFLTHDHYDHKKNIHIFDKELIFTAPGCFDGLEENHYLKPYDIVQFGKLTIIPLKTSHDATAGLGFEFICGEERLIYMTDTGYVSSKNANYMLDADYYIIESNHDVEMLMNTNRPMSLKNRILSDRGHLSNLDSALLMSRLIGEKTKEIVLAHLSREANTKELALGTYQEVFSQQGVCCEKLQIKVASQVDIVIGGKDK